jgi:hypothetical protein
LYSFICIFYFIFEGIIMISVMEPLFSIPCETPGEKIAVDFRGTCPPLPSHPPPPPPDPEIDTQSSHFEESLVPMK